MIYFLINNALAIVGILVAFRFGFRAGRQEHNLVSDPQIELPGSLDEGEVEQAPTDEEVREDMKWARTIASGYNSVD